ncbi:hypothetical protein Droror1_Dr00024276, partial [Drosera rotundifolia]
METCSSHDFADAIITQRTLEEESKLQPTILKAAQPKGEKEAAGPQLTNEEACSGPSYSVVSDGNAVMLMPSVGGVGTEGMLKDVSNLPQKRRLSSPNDKYRLISSYSANEQINMLLKASSSWKKMIFMKKIADRNKLIKLSGIELQKLRLNLLEVQQQYRLLARTIGIMVFEIMLHWFCLQKELRHELACARAMVAVKDFELQEKKKAKMHPRSVVKMHSMKSDKAEDPSQTNNNNNKPYNMRGK